MIVALLKTDGPDEIVMFLLEPANVAKLQLGQPVIKCLNDFLPNLPCKVEICLSYTPDVVWGRRAACGGCRSCTDGAGIAQPAGKIQPHTRPGSSHKTGNQGKEMMDLSQLESKTFDEVWDEEVQPALGPNTAVLKPIFRLVFARGEQAGLASAGRAAARIMDEFPSPKKPN
jgi:hypothetical protein